MPCLFVDDPSCSSLSWSICINILILVMMIFIAILISIQCFQLPMQAKKKQCQPLVSPFWSHWMALVILCSLYDQDSYLPSLSGLGFSCAFLFIPLNFDLPFDVTNRSIILTEWMIITSTKIKEVWMSDPTLNFERDTNR